MSYVFLSYQLHHPSLVWFLERELQLPHASTLSVAYMNKLHQKRATS